MYDVTSEAGRPIEVDDAPLADRTRAGFDDWVRPHLPSMRRLAIVAAPGHDPDDVVQDALLRAWQRWSTFRPARGSARTWLLAVTFDRARRMRGRRRQLTLVPLDADHETSTVDPTDRLALETAVAALPRRQREAIVLRYLVGLSTAEVAVLMKCSAGTVKSTLFDARRALAAQFGDDDA